MEHVIAFIIIFIISAIIAWKWVGGIDNMQKNHPDYKGEDFLNWDDDKAHTEGEF